MGDLARQMALKRHLICSNPECSPLFPFTGTALQRVYSEDKVYNLDGSLYETTMYCRICKGHYVYEVTDSIPGECPKCHTNKGWAIAKIWRMVCPKCGMP